VAVCVGCVGKKGNWLMRVMRSTFKKKNIWGRNGKRSEDLQHAHRVLGTNSNVHPVCPRSGQEKENVKWGGKNHRIRCLGQPSKMLRDRRNPK